MKFISKYIRNWAALPVEDSSVDTCFPEDLIQLAETLISFLTAEKEVRQIIIKN